MARPPSALPSIAVPAALTYLRRAVDRGGAIFTGDASDIKEALLALHSRLQGSEAPSQPAVLNEWLAAHVTSAGRRRLVDALRRKRADEMKGSAKPSKRALMLHADTRAGLEQLAEQVGAQSLTHLLSALANGNALPELRNALSQLLKSTDS